jgi:hypothetical protein
MLFTLYTAGATSSFGTGGTKFASSKGTIKKRTARGSKHFKGAINYILTKDKIADYAGICSKRLRHS